MTNATGGRHSPPRAWIGRSPTFTCTMRHSPAMPGPSQGVHSASRKTTPCMHARATPASHGSVCTMRQKVMLSAHQAHECNQQSSVVGKTRVNAAKEQIHVGMLISARHAEAHAPTHSVPAAGRRAIYGPGRREATRARWGHPGTRRCIHSLAAITEGPPAPAN